MPEGLEAEIYRRAAEGCVGRRIRSVDIDARQAMAVDVVEAMPGCTVRAARRIGKLVVIDTERPVGRGATRRWTRGPSLGLHFGMTGRLIVDDRAAIDRLEYSSRCDDPAWDRLVVRFSPSGTLRVNDPRRWAVFTVDPVEDRYGQDLFDVDVDELVARLARRRVALKTVLLDQGVIAGLGNMCVDEVLWQAGVSPVTPAADVLRSQVVAVVDAMRRHLPEMLRLGGSHCGVIDPDVRSEVPPCLRDGAPMRRDQVGGRTTVWCPVHQTAG